MSKLGKLFSVLFYVCLTWFVLTLLLNIIIFRFNPIMSILSLLPLVVAVILIRKKMLSLVLILMFLVVFCSYYSLVFSTAILAEKFVTTGSTFQLFLHFPIIISSLIIGLIMAYMFNKLYPDSIKFIIVSDNCF